MEHEKIYPHIEAIGAPQTMATAPIESYIEANSYRMHKILDIQNTLEREKEQRRKTHKKYKKAMKAVDVVDEVLATATVGTGVTGLVLLSTVVAAPVVIIMEAASIGSGFLCMVAKYINKKLQHKADKHNNILVLAKSKLNTIHNHISKAIEDGIITEEEFKLILEEEAKFNNMKDEIKSKKSNPQDKEQFEKGKQETMSRIKSFLDKP